MVSRGIYILHPEISININKNVNISKTFDILSNDTIIKLVAYKFINIIIYFNNMSKNTFQTPVNDINTPTKNIRILA